ncbi:MAG: NfeD family protein [Actinomycetota bacterium]
MRRVLASVVLLAALLAGGSALAAPATPTVIVVQVAGPIDTVVEAYLLAALERAESEGATLAIQLDSPGTLDVEPVALATRIHEASVPVLVWVGPTPAEAAGAALLLVRAASLAGVAPGAAVGPLLPLDVARPAASEPGLDATLARWASERGRTSPTAEPTEALPAQAAIDAGLVEVAAPAITDFLAAVDGRTVTTADGDAVLRTRVAVREGESPVEVRFTSLGPWERILHACATPSTIFLLLVVGFAAIAFEVTQPGFGFAGFSGIAALGLAVYGLTVVPWSVPGLALLVLGVGGLTADVALRRLGWLSAIGIAGFLAGSILAFRGVAPAIAISPWFLGGATVASVLYYGFALTVAAQSRDRIVSAQQGLVGLVGEARTDLTPEGGVHVKGTMWRGRSTGGTIPAGTRIRVRGLDGLVLRVEAEPGAPLSVEDEEEEA